MAVQRAIGRVLISLGTVVLLFVVYQLWGTGLREAQAQSDLTQEFSEALGAEAAPPGEATPPGQGTPPREPSVPPPQGEAVAVIRIPKIGVEKAVVEGVSVSDLRKAPGHYPDTPLPGQGGNAGIAGHRTTYGAPFADLDRLENGDEILVSTLQGEFRYAVDRVSVVLPTQVDVLDPTEEARLTLTTCHPRFSARERLIVSAVMLDEPVQGAVPVPAAVGPVPAPAGPEPDQAREREQALEGAGLVGDPSARTPALLLGALAAAAWVATTVAASRWRRLPAYVLGVPVVLVVLFLCFEQITRLMPASI